MVTRYINLMGIKSALDFVEAAKKIPCELSVQSGRYDLDAKSAMGLFSLDLTKEIKLEIHTEDKKIIQLADELLKPYVIRKE